MTIIEDMTNLEKINHAHQGLGEAARAIELLPEGARWDTLILATTFLIHGRYETRCLPIFSTRVCILERSKANLWEKRMTEIVNSWDTAWIVAGVAIYAVVLGLMYYFGSGDD